MIKTINKNSKMICYLLAFFIPVIFMLIISSALELSPFSWRAALVADAAAQFNDFYSYLKTIFFDNNTMLYTFSKVIGGDMAGFAFYYLGNPFVYLFAFIPNEYIPAGVLFVIILMMALSSLNFNIMVNNMFGFRWSSLLFSISYAFIGYYLAYFNCIIFFFNVMLLPIIILGLYEMIIKEKIVFKYTIFLALSIITNYYIGYMTCIFCCLFFLYLIVINKKEIINIKKHIYILGTFFIQTFLAVLISAVALVTVAFSLSSGQKGEEGMALGIAGGTNFRITDVFTGFYSISFNGNISNGLPIIYCGTLAVVFLILYFLNKEIKLKEKIASAILIAILILSFYIKFINKIWHGMAEPVGFPYRNSFFLSFFILLIAFKAFINIKQGTRKFHTLIVFSVFVIYSLYMLIIDSPYVGTLQIILTGSFLIMYLTGVYAICYKREYMYPITIGFFLILSFDLLLNGHHSLSQYFKNMEKEKTSVEYYSDYYNKMNEIYQITKTDNGDDGFYRMDKTFRQTNNDAMLVGYNGLSHFSSTESSTVLKFMKKLGFCSNNMWSYYGEDGNTAFADSFLSLKYLVSQHDETCKPYEHLDEINGKYIYKNPYAKSLAISVSDYMTEIETDKYNHFTVQNEIAKGITGKAYGIYRPVEVVDVNLENVERYEKTFTRIDPSKESYVEYELNITSSDFIYMYFDAPANQNTRININGLDKSAYFTTYGWSIKNLGYFNEGDVVPVRIILDQDEIEIDSYEFYYENKEELKRWYEDTLSSEEYVDEVTSSHLITTVDTDKEKILFTMPYDEGWKITVDGKKVKQNKALNCLMYIDVTKGKHVIEMKYIPRGLIEGAILSSVGIIILITLYIIERKRIRKILKGE